MQVIAHAPSLPLPMPCIPGPQRVLCYGADATLLMTRHLILNHFGFLCDMAMTAVTYSDQLHANLPGLIVFCHTLSAAQCILGADLAARESPRSKLLVLFTRVQKYDPVQRHATLSTHAGPDAFRRTVTRMMGDVVSELRS